MLFWAYWKDSEKCDIVDSCDDLQTVADRFADPEYPDFIVASNGRTLIKYNKGLDYQDISGSFMKRFRDFVRDENRFNTDIQNTARFIRFAEAELPRIKVLFPGGC